jgi:hypothetical protein
MAVWWAQQYPHYAAKAQQRRLGGRVDPSSTQHETQRESEEQ